MILALVLFCTQSYAQHQALIKGHVYNEKKQPLEFVSITIADLNVGTHTDRAGAFFLPINAADTTLTIVFRYVNKATVTQTIPIKNWNKALTIYLKDQSLTLKEVQVQAVRERLHSNSSIIIDREAIEQMQAFSLADVLQMLPGKKTEAPNLQSPQTLTLRTDATGQNALNNSFGIAIFIDGIRISNDANMQARSQSIRGIGGANISSQKYGSFDVAYNGFDLRDLPVERIERIEIIQGVADAKYGELTNGAILIATRAGKSPINVALRANGGSTQVTATKGIALGGKAGALNLSGGYTYSNADPRDKVKSYERINTNIQWSVDIGNRLTNTLGFGFDKRLDDVKADPDDDAERRTFESGHNINLSNRLSWQPISSIIQRVSLNASFSRGRQETYNQWLLNGPPKPVADKDTTGIYEGYYIPGAYLAVENIIGMPISINGSLDISSKSLVTGSLHHQIVAGASIASSGNNGAGIVIDPNRPRWGIVNNQSERPVDYNKLLPFLTNVGLYLQDNISGKLFNKKYGLHLGFRADIQNGYASYQPRLSGQYQLQKHWSVSLAYGVSTKAPSMAHRYPAPTWLDIPLLTIYNGNADESLFLVYTQKVPTDNRSLKAAKSSTLEFNVNYNGAIGGGSLSFYSKKNTDGFSSTKEYIPIVLPDYDYSILPDRTIKYFATGTTTLYAGVGRNIITNGLYSKDNGIELMFSTKEIKPIATKFALSSGIVYSRFDSRYNKETEPVSETAIQGGAPALYAVYKGKTDKNTTWNSTFSGITHIPKLGFTVNVSMDLSLLQSRIAPKGDNLAIGYFDRNMQYISIPEAERANAEYAYLKRDLDMNQKSTLPFVYANLNVSIAKEIKKKIRLMIRGYNLFNIRPRYNKPGTNSFIVYNNPASITAGISITL